MKLFDWKNKYADKTGEYPVLPHGFKEFYHPDRGFAQVMVDEENSMLIIWHLCGDARFWRDVCEIIAIEKDINYISTVCTRKIEPYIRFWKSTIDRVEELSDGNKRYFGHDYKGRPFFCSPSHTDGDEVVYFVNQSMKGGIDNE